jgi:hypothetical protein
MRVLFNYLYDDGEHGPFIGSLVAQQWGEEEEKKKKILERKKIDYTRKHFYRGAPLLRVTIRSALDGPAGPSSSSPISSELETMKKESSNNNNNIKKTRLFKRANLHTENQKFLKGKKKMEENLLVFDLKKIEEKSA